MSTLRFGYVDVFAERPLTGNPLTVVPDADNLSVEQMQAIAREFNQSETTFLLSPTLPGAAWRLRSFTPGRVEVGGAGHNALGAWLWLAHAGQAQGALQQEIAGELLPVDLRSEAGGHAQVVMTQSAPTFGATVADTAALAAALGLLPSDLGGTAQVVSTGVGHLLIPACTRSGVDAARPDPTRLALLLHAARAEGAYLYTTEPTNHQPKGVDEHRDDVQAYARFFNPTVGISEDPATGTAAGPLAARLVRDGQVGDPGRVVIQQGVALGRPSRIVIDIDGASVRLCGSGRVVGEGTLWI